MRKSRTLRFLFSAAILVGFSTAAFGQATRTWVSGVGDDANPCSRTAPCKTFAGAISKTATGGEISVLDPGGFGAVTITKSITLNGDGTLAGILSSLAAQAILVNINSNLGTDKVIIRNISINGGGNGVRGVKFIDGDEVILDNVTISGMTDAGVDVVQTQSGNLFLLNVRISKCLVGVRSQTTAGTVTGAFDNVSIYGMTSHGMQFVNNSKVAIRNCLASRAGGSGVRSEAASVDVSIENTISSGNNFGFEATAGSVRITNCGMYYNNTNLTANVFTGGGNRSAGNTANNNPTPGGVLIQ
jgi:hypothetical protein